MNWLCSHRARLGCDASSDWTVWTQRPIRGCDSWLGESRLSAVLADCSQAPDTRLGSCCHRWDWIFENLLPDNTTLLDWATTREMSLSAAKSPVLTLLFRLRLVLETMSVRQAALVQCYSLHWICHLTSSASVSQHCCCSLLLPLSLLCSGPVSVVKYFQSLLWPAACSSAPLLSPVSLVTTTSATEGCKQTQQLQ